MSGDPRHHQDIRYISVQQGSRAYIGTFSNCDFGNTEESQKAAIACRSALFLTDPHVDRESVISAKGTRVAGTCEWITQNETYRAWLKSDGDGNGGDSKDNNTRLLWITGGPGKGKTMMSIFLTEELERHTARIDSAELAFFFCSAEDQKRNTAVAVLRGLIHQIIAKRPQLVKHALLYFETPERTQQTVSSLETLWIIFNKLIADAKLGTMFYVLDGLDECDDSTLRVLLPRIVSLFTSESSSSTKGTFKLAIVSRDLPGLRGCTTRVRLDPDNDEKVVSDIELFVSARVAELSRIEGFDDTFRASVQTALLDRAEGTFLWVGFAMHELSQKQTCSAIWKANKNLPSGLPAIYSRMLLRIPAEQRETSQAILRWVTMAARPLQLRELAAAVGVQDMPPMTAEQVARDAVVLCGPLLKLQKQNVSLIHQSARDYLLRKEEDSDIILEAYRIRPQNMHLEIVQSSLDCIMQSGFQQRVVDLDAKLGSRESPLLQYAALHWLEHAKNIPSQDVALVQTLKRFFCTRHASWKHWWMAYKKKRHRFLPGDIPLLHMLCYLGFVPLVEQQTAWEGRKPRFFKRIDDKDSCGNTALHLAVTAQHQEVAELLISKGAGINERDRYKRTPLHLAAEREDLGMAQLLIRRRADINAEEWMRDTVLHSALTKREDYAVARLLIDKGANVNAMNMLGKTALHLAAEDGNAEIVRWLVDVGADVNAGDGHRPVLHSAVRPWEMSRTIMLILINRGADLNTRDHDGLTALHRAAEEGNRALVRLLLGEGAFVNTVDASGRTPLHHAAYELQLKVVLLLASKGADLNARANDGCTVLHETISALAGASRGNRKLVELLIRMGVNVGAKNKDGKTARRLAVKEGNKAVERLLWLEEWALGRRRIATGRRQFIRRTRFPKPRAH